MDWSCKLGVIRAGIFKQSKGARNRVRTKAIVPARQLT